jgi:hypothetical protein
MYGFTVSCISKSSVNFYSDLYEINNAFLSTQQTSSLVFNMEAACSKLTSHKLIVAPSEAMKLLASVKNKSAGPDSVPAWVLKSYAETLANPVSKLFTASFQQGKMPQCFKKATIIPLPKPNSTEYRPISLLPHLSKLMEKVVRDRWLKRLLSTIDSSQFAFTGAQGSGTTTALVSVNSRILQHLDIFSGASRVLLIDFSKAFDKANHSIVLEKLSNCNVPKECLMWIASFLENRQQRVLINDTKSSWQNVISGVPQGSVLGPALFAVLISSLTPLHPNSTLVKYADDITLIHNIRGADEDHLQEEFNSICSWSSKNFLPINFQKTKVLDICTKKKLVLPMLIGPNGTPIESIKEGKLLGINLSSSLKWDSHVQSTTQRARRQLYALKVLKGAGAPDKLLWEMYTATIRSVLTL